ncbi:MAG: hypothetical protein IKQ69_04020 [Oscillospiraceae bacterium]|nr:hypothetical protein [Oscillospiraceae bacterium]
MGLNGSEIWHEFNRHSDATIEQDRGQIALDRNKIVEAITAVFDPDIVEGLFTESTNDHRRSFAIAKKTAGGSYVIVEAVGGNNNPTFVPIQIVEVSDDKWNQYYGAGKTLGEMLYENDPAKLGALDITENKNNRVIAAQFTSKEVIANTPHSPRSDDSITQSSKKSNPQNGGRASEEKHIEKERQLTKWVWERNPFAFE